MCSDDKEKHNDTEPRKKKDFRPYCCLGVCCVLVSCGFVPETR